jgi:hypothetical protein
MLDRLTPAQRHGVLLAIAGALGFLMTNIDLFGLPDSVKAIVAPAVAFLLAFVTPLTKQYGAASNEEDPGDPALVEGEVVGEGESVDA